MLKTQDVNPLTANPYFLSPLKLKHYRKKHLLASEVERPPAVTLLCNRKLDTLALGQRDPRLLLANDENVALTCGELVVNGVLDVDDVETSVVALTVGDDTDTTHVATAGNHGDDTSVEGDEVCDLAGSQVNLYGVVDADLGVGVANTIVESG